MKIRRIILWLLVPLVIALTACDHTLGYTIEPVDSVYTAKIEPMQNGSIKAVPAGGIAGTEITLLVNPRPGYMLEVGSILRSINGDRPIADQNLREPPYRFDMDADCVITANFVKVPVNNYSISVDENIVGGTIAAYTNLPYADGLQLNAAYGPAGRPVLLKFYPEPGFALKENSVSYIRLNNDGIPTSPPIFISQPFNLSMPAAHVLFTAEFESPDAQDLVESGKRALLRDDYNSAVIAFEAAYTKDKNNTEAIFYSTMGKLAGIAVDEKVRQLMRRLGIGAYPGDLNNLLTPGDSWDNYVTAWNPGTGSPVPGATAQRPGWLESYSGIFLPQLMQPSGYYAFQNQEYITQRNVDSHALPTMARFLMHVFFNLMGSNTEKLNLVVDDALKYVFGSEFEAAAKRAATLEYGPASTIVLSQALVEKLFLQDILEGGDHVGRAELDIVFASLQTAKAALEWVAGYDLGMDKRIFRLWSYNNISTNTFWPEFPGLYDFLDRKYVGASELIGNAPSDTELLNDVVYFFLHELDVYFNQLYSEDQLHGTPVLPSVIPDMLPLRNAFLRERSGAQARMDKTKADLIRAVDYLSGAYAYYSSAGAAIPQAARDKLLTKYRWAGDCLAQLKTAIQTGGTFYFPGDLPQGPTAWNYNAGNAKNGINWGRFFIPGQLGLEKFIVTETGGKLPKSYGWNSNTGIEGAYIASRADIAKYQHIGFKFNLTSLKQVFVQGLEKDGRPLADTEYVHTLFPDILFTPQNGEYLYVYYHDLYSYVSKK